VQCLAVDAKLHGDSVIGKWKLLNLCLSAELQMSASKADKLRTGQVHELLVF
jgi:hypothetical protein